MQGTDTTTYHNYYCLRVKAELNSYCRDLTKVVLLQETQELQNKSRWELIKETLNKKFTSPLELKASITAMSFY